MPNKMRVSKNLAALLAGVSVLLITLAVGGIWNTRAGQDWLLEKAVTAATILTEDGCRLSFQHLAKASGLLTLEARRLSGSCFEVRQPKKATGVIVSG